MLRQQTQLPFLNNLVIFVTARPALEYILEQKLICKSQAFLLMHSVSCIELHHIYLLLSKQKCSCDGSHRYIRFSSIRKYGIISAVVLLLSLALRIGLMRRLPTSSCPFPFLKKPLTLFYIICTLPVVDLPPPSLHMHESSFMCSGLTTFEMPAPPLYTVTRYLLQLYLSYLKKGLCMYEKPSYMLIDSRGPLF